MFQNGISTFSLVYNTALHIACENSNKEIIDMLLRRKEINVNMKNKKGMTPLHFACLNDKIEIVKGMLLIGSIDCNIRNVLSICISMVFLLFDFFDDFLYIFFFLWKLPSDLTRNRFIKKRILDAASNKK